MKLRGRIEFHKYTIQVSTGTLIPQCGQKVKKKTTHKKNSNFSKVCNNLHNYPTFRLLHSKKMQ